MVLGRRAASGERGTPVPGSPKSGRAKGGQGRGGVMVQGLGLVVQGVGFRIWGLGFSRPLLFGPSLVGVCPGTERGYEPRMSCDVLGTRAPPG